MPSYALIAEPDPSQAQVYRHIALAEGFEVELARDGAEALSAFRTRGAPGLLITELSLARTDGFALLQELRRLSPEEQSPAVVISAFRTLRDTAVKLRDELGISALLARSSPVESIRRAIRKALAGSASPHSPARPPEPPPPEPPRPEAVNDERAEELRLQHLDEMDLVDEAPPEESLQQIVREVAAQFKVSTSMISLVLEDKQWFKAHVGLDESLARPRGTTRDWSFCSHVVQGRAPLVVPDAAVHPLFAQNPLVQNGLVRSYAGAPLETPGGHVLGSLCIIDKKPLAISAADVDQLMLVAKSVAGELELLSARRKKKKDEALPLAAALKAPDGEAPSFHGAISYLSAVVDNIDNGILLLDPSRRVLLANRAAAELFGTSEAALIGRTREEVLRELAQSFKDPQAFLERMRVAEKGPYALRVELELERPRRRILRLLAKPVELEGGIGQLGVIHDVTAEVDLLRERDVLARTDPVTALPNRRAGEEVLEREAARAQRFGSRVSVAMFDVDFFKRVNDQHGHAAGDEALRAVAQVLGGAIRGADVAARWGGDEFLAILPSTGLEGAKSFAERVRARFEALPKDRVHGLTLSCGVAELAQGEDGGEALLRADTRLFAAKEAGRNRVA